MLTYKVNDRVLSVKLTGDIDHHSVIAIRERIDEILFEEDIIKLVFDLSETSFMDSSGLGFIMGRYALMKEIGGSLSLRDPSPVVMKMLTMTGFDKKVRISNTAKI